MRVVELRRHSQRNPGDPHLSNEGRDLARRVALTIGPFERVVTSPLPRAVETAEALGFRVDATIPELAPSPDSIADEVDRATPRSFGDYVRLLHGRPALLEYARHQVGVLAEELERVSEGGRLLMISHGNVIEFAAAAACPKDAATFGAVVRYLEGFRVQRERGRWTHGEAVRVPG